MAVKAINDTAGPNGLVPTLLVYRAYLRISKLDPPTPSAKVCAQALYVRIIPIGSFYLYVLLVAYYLRYTSTLSTRLSTLGVLIY